MKKNTQKRQAKRETQDEQEHEPGNQKRKIKIIMKKKKNIEWKEVETENACLLFLPFPTLRRPALPPRTAESGEKGRSLLFFQIANGFFTTEFFHTKNDNSLSNFKHGDILILRDWIGGRLGQFECVFLISERTIGRNL